MDAKGVVSPLLLALGSLASSAGAAEPGPRVRHQLEVETAEGRVQVRLTIENHGDTTIYVPREVAAGDAITKRRFDLRDAQGGPVAYTGMLVKRAALTASDYQAVAPHTMHMNTIDITPSYAFKRGKHSYEIRYDGPWLPDTARLDALEYSPAAPLRFSVTGN